MTPELLDFKREVDARFNTIEEQNREILTALKGSSLGRDGGLVGRVEDLEKEVQELKDENIELKQDLKKGQIHLQLVYLAVGVAVHWLFTYALSVFFKK